jgi:hypothetical protein
MDTDLETIQSLLQQVQVLVSKEKAIQDEKYRRGESFNIFKACGVNHYEVTHSSILAEFLNPRGTHGQGLEFLNEFLKIKGIDDFAFNDIEDVVVATEHAFSVKTKEGNYAGRIDILIHDLKKAIIIENKIYAKDQYDQLSRYEAFAKEHYPDNYKIVYLTLDQHDPNDESSKKVSYIPISYSEHIIDWLTACKSIMIDKPLIRETLTQYIQHIKELTNTIDMDNENKKRLLDLIMMYPEAVSEIIAIRHEFEVELVQKINAILEDIARKTNLEYKCSSDFYSKSKSCYLSFCDKRWNGLEIIFEFDNKDWRNMFVGVADKVHYDEHQSQEYHKLNCFKQKPIYSWTYGWDWIEEKYINWDITCLVDIVKNPDSFKSYITNLVQTIVSNLKDEKIIDNF